jgi:hypothetical protein
MPPGDLPRGFCASKRAASWALSRPGPSVSCPDNDNDNDNDNDALLAVITPLRSLLRSGFSLHHAPLKILCIRCCCLCRRRDCAGPNPDCARPNPSRQPAFRMDCSCTSHHFRLPPPAASLFSAHLASCSCSDPTPRALAQPLPVSRCTTLAVPSRHQQR